MGMRVKGKVTVITGSTRGIGEGIARSMAAEGAIVVVSGINVDEGQQTAHDLTQAGQQAMFVKADVTKEADCAGLIQSTVDRFGRLDVLVNNAGIFPSVPVEKTTPDLWDQVFAVNVRGAFLCCRAVIPAMQQQGGGVIINIGSILAHRAHPDRLA